MIKKLLFGLLALIVMSAKAQVVANWDWTYNYGNTTTPSLSSIASAIDDSKNIFVTGIYQGATKDLVVLKFDSLGTLLWSKIYNNGGDDQGNAIAVNKATGDVAVCGKSYGNATTGFDYIVIKYTSSGTQTFAKRVNLANLDDEATDIKMDASGNVFVTGTGNKGGTRKKDIFSVKFTATGTQTWTALYDGGVSDDDYGVSLVLSSNGNTVYVAGNKGTGSGVNDIVVQALKASTGGANWTYTVNGTASGNDLTNAMILSGANVVLCGQMVNTTTNEDYTLIKLNGSTGALIFRKDYDSGNKTNYATSLCRDSTGNIGVTGRLFNGTYNEYHTLMYDSTGVLIWSNIENTFIGSTSIYPKIANDTIAHHWYVMGEVMNTTNDISVYQITPTGNTTWKKTYDRGGYDAGMSFAVNGIGEIYIAAITTNGGSGYDITTLKLSQTPAYFPPDIVPNETPNVSHLFIENKGQILLLDTTKTVATEVLYSCTDTYPMTYIGLTKFSYKFTHADTALGGNDTIQRIDVNMFHADQLTTVYPFDANHGSLSYMQEGLPDAVVGAKGYERLMVPNIYPYIDMHYYSNRHGLKLYYVVKPYGGVPSAIKWNVEGANSTTITGSALKINGFNGTVSFEQPKIYTVDSTGAAVSLTATASWTNVGTNMYGVSISGTYPLTKPLIIEMAYGTSTVATQTGTDNIIHSTYYGGITGDAIKAVSVDKNTGRYVTLAETKMYAMTPVFPVVSGSLVSITTNTNSNGVLFAVMLFDKDGRRMAVNTYGYAGASYSMCPMNVILQGNLITVVGNADVAKPGYIDPVKADLPLYNSVTALTPGTYTNVNGAGYVIQFQYSPVAPANPSIGSINNILWATRLNGWANDIAKTPDGNSIYITTTFNGNFSTDTKTVSGSWNNAAYYGFFTFRVSKFDSLGVRKWATVYPCINTNYLKNNQYNFTNNNSQVYMMNDVFLKCKIACDNYGFSMAGETDTTHLKICSKYGAPTYTAFGGFTDGFYARFNKKDSIVYSSYVPGAGFDAFTALTPVGTKETMLVGYSNSRNYKTNICTAVGANPYTDTTNNGTDVKMLIAKFDTTGVKTWCTFYGTSNAGTNIYAWGATADNNGNKVYITGRDYGYGAFDFVKNPNPVNTYSNSNRSNTESFMLAFDGSNNPAWNTYFGGEREDVGMGLAFNPVKQSVILVGLTNTQNIPYPVPESPYFPIRPDQSGDNTIYLQKDCNNSQGIAGPYFPYDGFITNFSINEVVGIKEYFKDKRDLGGFKLFPNPAQNETSMAFKDEMRGNVKIEVFNEMGQLVGQINRNGILPFSVIDLNTYNYANGLYIVTVSNADVRYSKKLIIQR